MPAILEKKYFRPAPSGRRVNEAIYAASKMLEGCRRRRLEGEPPPIVEMSGLPMPIELYSHILLNDSNVMRRFIDNMRKCQRDEYSAASAAMLRYVMRARKLPTA